MRRLISVERYEAEARALLAKADWSDAQKATHAAFVSCLCPPGLFQFTTDVLGFRAEGRSGSTGMINLGQLQRELCDVLDSEPERALILLPRGHFKSTIATIAAALHKVCYYWPNQESIAKFGGIAVPPPRIIIVSWGFKLLRDLMGNIKRLAEKPEIYSRFPHSLWGHTPRPFSSTWSGEELHFPNGASIVAASLNSLPTGLHGDVVICDDIVDEESVGSPDLIADVKHRFGLLNSVLNPGGQMWVVGTHYHYDDLYAELKSRRGWVVHKRTCYREDGSPSFPERFTAAQLESIREEQGPYVFSCQYLLDPVADGEQVFKDWWIKSDCDGTERGVITIACDPAISMKDTACFTAITVVASGHDGERYLIDRLRQRLDVAQTVEALASYCEKYNPAEVAIEAIQYQQALVEAFEAEMRRRGRWWRIAAIKGYGNSKIDRIKKMVPDFAAMRWHLKPEHDDVRRELADFPYGKTVDVIDSMSMHYGLEAFRGATETVGVTPVERARQRQATVDYYRRNRGGKRSA